MFGFEHSITRVDVKCLCENRQILQCCLKGFIGPSFRACSLIKFSKKQKKSTLAAKFCHINGLYLGGMDPELLVCVLLSVFGEKMLVFYLFGQQNISLKQSVIAMQAI